MRAAGRHRDPGGFQAGIRHRPLLDPGFVPAISWCGAFEADASRAASSLPVSLAIERPDGGASRWDGKILPHDGVHAERNLEYVERIVKLLLWSRGGSKVLIAGPGALVEQIAAAYAPNGSRAFDHEMFGRVFREPLAVLRRDPDEVPATTSSAVPLGRHLRGCRVGFDLGGSDRKSAAVIDGRVVHSEEVEWNPYFASDPKYHFEGILDSIRRAAEHLPRIDAIGGSAAGIYVDNEPRLASLFRGVSDSDFDSEIRPIFHRLRAAFGDVPFEVANDGEVTALAASMSSDGGSVLGIAMGTSLAAGYCDASGSVTRWLNELAFAPVDYRDDAPRDEWSGDRGCGVQYFSQQAVARLAPRAGIEFAAGISDAERLAEIQRRIERGEPGALDIFETLGAYLGYSIAWYAKWYEIRNLLVLGRLTTGEGGIAMIAKAEQVLRDEFPSLAERLEITTPDERLKRHGQAIAAASLPKIPSAEAAR